MEVPASDVIQLILQFMRENKFDRSCKELENESGVKLALVPQGVNRKLHQAILDSDWKLVLQQLSENGIELPFEIAWELYERICGDLVCASQEGAAIQLLTKTKILQKMKIEDGKRFDALSDCVYHDFSSARSQLIAARASVDDALWIKNFADRVCALMYESKPSQLLELLGNALAYRAQNGIIPQLLEWFSYQNCST